MLPKVPPSRQKSILSTLLAFIVSALQYVIRFGDDRCDAGPVVGLGPEGVLSPEGNEVPLFPEGNVYPEGSLSGRKIPRRCVELDNDERCYYSYVPECASGPTPVVLDLHYGIACPSASIVWTGFLELADEKCFAVMWPLSSTEGFIPCWKIPGGAVDPNDSTNVAPDFTCGAGPADEEDYKFVREMALDFANRIPSDSGGRATLNSQRFYTTGLSNGCQAAISFAMLQSDFVAAVACFSGTWQTAPSNDYMATPIMEFHGLRDVLFPYNAGDGLFSSGNIFPIQTTFAGLSVANGCNNSTTEEYRVPDMDVEDEEGIVTIQTATECNNGAEVKLVSFSTAGHITIGGVREVTPTAPFAASTTIDTTLLAWEFMERFESAAVPEGFA